MYVMHRRGWLTPSQKTDNQCKTTGHDKYHYHIIMACSEDLDDDAFIIDHMDIDRALQRSSIKGSCEEMHKIMFTVVEKLFKKTEAKLYAYKCILSPTIPNGDAYMEYFKLLDHLPPPELQYVHL